MRHVSVLLLLSVVAMARAQAPANLLVNPGFEDGAGGLQGWSVEKVDPAGPLYWYRLRAAGGGHGDAVPHAGTQALEIYSDNTRLRQTVELGTGTYVLTVWARNNGGSGDPRLLLCLGQQRRRVAVLSDRYRQYYARFEVDQAQALPVSLISTSLGIAVDDLALWRLGPGEPLPEPYLYLDLLPAGGERSRNVQTYIKGMKQWLNFTLTAVDPQRLGTPDLVITVPPAVALSGLNQTLLNHYRPDSLAKAEVAVTTGTDAEGGPVTRYRFPCPRLVNGPENPISFGGCFIEVASGAQSWVRLTVQERAQPLAEESLSLVPIDPPARQRTPRLLRTLSYGVQDWKADLAGRLATIPAQFRLMGLNVWSEYQITRNNADATPTADEQVMALAAREYGVQAFWPNYSELLSGADPSGAAWGNAARAAADSEPYRVGADGSVDTSQFSLRYAAAKGRYWADSALQAHRRTMDRPHAIGLPYHHGGFITDALEGLYCSYDPATLADFAKQKGLDPATVSVASVSGPQRQLWLSYNNALYAQVAANLAEALRAVAPQAMVCNTAGPYGPAGTDDLPLAERAAWGRTYDITMPQWYSLRYFGSLYSDTLAEGVAAKVYGRANGYPDVIPLLCNSMGVQTEDLACIRFKVIDLVSSAALVKGIGYYSGTNAFADARWMVGISQVHTLLADLEDYYANGPRRDDLASFAKVAGGVVPVETLDESGQQATVVPAVTTACRVHLLGQGGRRALITLVSHSNQGVGEQGRLTLDLNALGATAETLVYDHLAGRKLPLAADLVVDTRTTGSLAILELAERLPLSGAP